MTCPECRRSVTSLVEASKLDSRLDLTACAKCCVYAYADLLRTKPARVLKATNRVSGQGNPRSKFTEAMVVSIRKGYAEGATQKQLAKGYGCSVSSVSKIVNGRNWGHV